MEGNFGCIKVNAPRQKTPHIRGLVLPIPITILERYKEVALLGGIMFVNGIRFINTISINLKFMMAEHILNAEATTQQKPIKQVKQVYMQLRFNVTNIRMDGKLAFFIGNLVELQINLNVYSNHEHSGEIERLNRTVKERVRLI